MDQPTLIRVVAGVLAVIILVILIQRRRSTCEVMRQSSKTPGRLVT